MSEGYDEEQAKFNRCAYAILLGMRLVELSQGYARVALLLRPEFGNWEQQVHGGLIVSLADQAFGAALNTGEKKYVAVQVNMNFITSPRQSETLFGEARAIHLGKRLGVAQLTVKDASDRVIAQGQGTAVALE